MDFRPVNEVTVDLHGVDVTSAVKTVAKGLDTFPACVPDGIVVKYVTGRGAHSPDGRPRLKLAVQRFLDDRGVTYRVGTGWIQITFPPMNPTTVTPPP